MAMVSELKGRAFQADGNLRETYSCYMDATTGTITLPANQDLRFVLFNARDTSTAGTSLQATSYNMATGVLTVATGIATTALTGVSGGVAGGNAFVATGGVIGTRVSGDANLQANTMIVNVVGTAITVDKPVLGAIAAANINTHAMVEILYCP